MVKTFYPIQTSFSILGYFSQSTTFDYNSEIIQDGINGFLVDSYNLTQICECIQIIISDFRTYKNFALNARKRAEDFCKENFLSGIETILESLGNKID